MKYFAAALLLLAPGLHGPLFAATSTTEPAFVQEGEEEAEDLSGLSIGDLAGRIKSERDDVGVAVVDELASRGSREALDALLESYDQFGSLYMKIAVVRALGTYDASPDAFQPALEFVMNVVSDNPARELRGAAIETLGKAREHGKPFLALLVESSVTDEYRERAMDLHVRMGSDEDKDWYKKIFERSMEAAQKEIAEARKASKKKKKKGKKGDDAEAERQPFAWPSGRLRAAALGVIIGDLDDAALLKVLDKDRSLSVVSTVLTELANRDAKGALEQAEKIAESVGAPGSLRVIAAEIIMQKKGASCARDMIDLALQQTSPGVLRNRIADLIAELDDEKVQKQIAKLVGKGKGYERTFAIRASKNLDDPKLVKKFRKDIKNRDAEVAVATIGNLASRRDRESVPAMEKLLDKTKSADVRRALLEALSTIYDGENAWVERLVGYTDHENVDLRNAAILEIARLGRSNMLDLFVERLSHDDWSTRYAALGALEKLHRAEVVGPIVGQMQNETGRMSREFGDALFRLTGQSFGKRPKLWARWFKDNEGKIDLLDEKELESLLAANEERRLKQITRAEFFGIRIESHRVIFIIDVSGSMNETLRARYVDERGRVRIDVAKEELSKVIKALEDNALFNVLTFSTGVETWVDGVDSSSESTRAEALEYVSRLGADGGTNLYGALLEAFQDEDVDTIFLLSDGEPSVGEIIDPQLIREEILRRNETRGVVIHSIAIGGALRVLEWLATDSGGTYVGIQ